MRPQSLIIAFFALVLFCSAQAEIYKTVDKNGAVSFSDKPTRSKNTSSTEKVEVKEVNSTPAVTLRSITAPTNTEQAVRYKISITSPSDGADIGNNQRHLTIAVATTPGLAEGLRLQAISNGQRFGDQTVQGNSITLNNITPGEQQLQAQIVDINGKVIANSSTVTVNVHRAQAPRRAPRAN